MARGHSSRDWGGGGARSLIPLRSGRGKKAIYLFVNHAPKHSQYFYGQCDTEQLEDPLTSAPPGRAVQSSWRETLNAALLGVQLSGAPEKDTSLAPWVAWTLRLAAKEVKVSK